MARFVYMAYDRAGARHKGNLSALDMESARYKLKEMGLVPVKIRKSGEGTEMVKAMGLFRPRPKAGDIEFLTSQLAMLVKNGVRVDRSLAIVRQVIGNSALARVIDEIHEEIRRGSLFSTCLEKYPNIFSPLYVSAIRIGEATGRLGDTLENLASNLSFRRKISASTRQAMIYPTVIFCVCVLAILFVFNFIVPRLSVVFAGMESLPAYTELFLAISRWFRQWQYFLVAGALLIAVLGRRYGKNELLKRAVDGVAVKIPVVRGLFYILENMRFASSLAVLLKSGVLLNDALDHAVKTVGNVHIRKKLMAVKRDVREGKRLAEAISKAGFFAPEYNGLVQVGEEAGTLTEVFSEIEQRLRAQFEMKVEALITLIEPAMIIVMGLIVGSIVVVMLLSIMSVSDINF